MFWNKKNEEDKKSTLEVLEARSGNAVKLITDTIEELKQTNVAINDEKAVIAEKIEALNQENAKLNDLTIKNSRIVSNFESLLN